MDQETLAKSKALEESLWHAELGSTTTLDKTFFEFSRSGRTYARCEMMFGQSGFGEINAALPLPNFVRAIWLTVAPKAGVIYERCRGMRDELISRYR
jgi:hypothetical protein